MSNDSDNDSDDFGPMPAQQEEEILETVTEMPAKKKARQLEFESLYLDKLPTAEYYEHSYMHRDIVTHIAVSKATEFIMTGSADGHVKFWKKMIDNIEFVKHYQAHLGPIHAMVVSSDGKQLVTTSSDKMIKFFEVSGFDMSNMVSCTYIPTCAAWLAGPHNINDRVAIADQNSGTIRIYKSESESSKPLHEINLHMSPVKCMSLNYSMSAIISADTKGMIEYWDINTLDVTHNVSFTMKMDTDLYDLAKSKTVPYNIAVAPGGRQFAILSKDKQIRVFDYLRGKLARKYDESVSVYAAGSANIGSLDNIELGRRQAMERELEASPETLAQSTLQYDESGHFLIFGSLRGIKLLNLTTNKVSRIVGSGESGERFLAIGLYQGVPQVDSQLLLARAGAEGGMTKTVDQLNITPLNDPTIFCTSFKKRRFYCFSTRPPDETNEGRDKLNEMPTEEEKVSTSEVVNRGPSNEAVLRTNLGDIHIKLFASECPRTIENFTTHIRNKYYNGLIFHRVIKGFMLQTGDPKGNGTGGESIWGGEFEDEFRKNLRHDRPFTVSMANAGPNTNGSQFFITTVPTPWLDGKHTVFGRVTKGFEVCTQIENVKVNRVDKPYEEIKILSADVH